MGHEMITYNKAVLSELLTSLSVFTHSNVSLIEDSGENTKTNSLTSVDLCLGVKECIRDRCIASDNAALKKISQQSEAFYYYCHFGMIEIILKFSISKEHHIALLLGPFRDPRHQKKDIENIMEFCRVFKKNSAKMIKNYRKIPRFTMQKFEAIKNLTTVIMEYSKTTKLISSKENFLDEELNPYIEKHIDEKIIIGKAAKDLNVTTKQLERIVRLCSGISPKKYLQRYKVLKAYEDIRYTTTPLPDIASAYGFDDYNYFIKVFKTIKGITPSKARKEGNIS